MARVGIVFGLLLCALTVTGLVVSLDKGLVQFVPMMLGIPILFCGVVALNPHRRRHAMHFSAGIAGVGALLGGGRASALAIGWIRGAETDPLALRMVSVMAVSCLVFVVICLLSFLHARRRNRTESTGKTAATTETSRAGREKPELETSGVGQD